MITAKAKLARKQDVHDGVCTLAFQANYTDDDGNRINEDWANATPHLSLSMTVNAEAAKHFTEGKSYTLSFEEE